MRLIDSVNLINTIVKKYGLNAGTVGDIIIDIDNQPIIDPVKHGHWVGVNPMVDTLMCSECGENILGEEFKSNYCPNCGAKMDKVIDN